MVWQFSLRSMFFGVGALAVALALGRMAWAAARSLDPSTLGLLGWIAGLAVLAVGVGLVFVHANR